MRKKIKKKRLRNKRFKKVNKNKIISPFLFFITFLSLFSLITLIIPVGAYNEKFDDKPFGLPKLNINTNKEKIFFLKKEKNIKVAEDKENELLKIYKPCSFPCKIKFAYKILPVSKILFLESKNVS